MEVFASLTIAFSARLIVSTGWQMRKSRRGECLRNGMFRLRFHVAYLAEKLLLGPLGHRRFGSALHVWLPLLTAPEMQPTRLC